MAAPMSPDEIARLATSIRGLLDDPDGGLSEAQRRRWEGALAALEAVLGRKSSLVDNLDL